jgi:hypothetical protein
MKNNINPLRKIILPRLALAALAAALSMPVPSAAKGKDPNRQEEEADAANDKQASIVRDAKEIRWWNQRIDQFAAPFLDEFLKDETERKNFEQIRVRQLALEKKTRETLATFKKAASRHSTGDSTLLLREYSDAIDAEGVVVDKNMKELKKDRKQIDQLMTKTIKSVRDAAKTEADPARKKELLEKAQRANDGWTIRKLPVDPKKPLPAAPK